MHRNKKSCEIEDVPVEVVELDDEQQAASDEDIAEIHAEVEAEDDDEVALEQPEADDGLIQDAAEGDVPACDTIEQACTEVNINDESTLSIDGGVVEKIVAMTAREVDGVLQLKGNLINSLPGLRGSDTTKGVSVEMSGDDACTVNIAVILEYGKSAPRVFQELHDKVAGAIETMTGLKVTAVNVRVTNVLTRAEIEGGRRKDKSEA